MKRLTVLGLLKDTELPLPSSLVEACHEEQLVGGVSLSRRATPDEVLGPLTFAMGGAAAKVKLLDVRSGPSMTLELRVDGEEDRWKVRDVDDLIEQLGERFLDDDDVKQLVVLGEHEGMLEVWALRPDVLEALLHTRLLDGATNLRTLREFFEL